MNLGATLISYDVLGVKEHNCVGVACHKQQINYSAAMRQIIALVRESEQCHQQFKFQVLINRFHFQRI